MESIQLFPVFRNLNQLQNPKGSKGEFLEVLLTLFEGFKKVERIKEGEKEKTNIFVFNGAFKKSGKGNKRTEDDQSQPINFKVPVYTRLILELNEPKNNAQMAKEYNTKNGNNGIVNPDKEVKLENRLTFVKSDKNLELELIKQRDVFTLPFNKTHRAQGKPMPTLGSGNIKTLEVIEKMKKNIKNTLEKKELPENRAIIQPSEREWNFITAKKSFKNNSTHNGLIKISSLKDLGTSKEEKKKNSKIEESSPVLVEIKEYKKEKFEVKKSELRKLIKNFSVSNENNIKKIKIEIKDIGMEMRFLKENATLFLKIKDFNNSFITSYDAVRISQIFQSAGFRLESLNVNGSEIYRDRERERERGNIGVNEPDENSGYTTSSNFSVLL